MCIYLFVCVFQKQLSEECAYTGTTAITISFQSTHKHSRSSVIAFQEIQQDIDQHSTEVTSVLTLCEDLLKDADACYTEKQADSLRDTKKTLDQQWRHISEKCQERRTR